MALAMGKAVGIGCLRCFDDQRLTPGYRDDAVCFETILSETTSKRITIAADRYSAGNSRITAGSYASGKSATNV